LVFGCLVVGALLHEASCLLTPLDAHILPQCLHAACCFGDAALPSLFFF
jgi:hypothetical protein